jgi:hypothetical protein
MRLSDLLEQEVVDQNGRSWGQIHDVYLVQDGPIVGTGNAAFRLHGLVAGRGAVGTRLGYVGRPGYEQHQQTRGPWAIRALVRRMHRRAVYVAWADVVAVSQDEVKVRCPPSGFDRADSVSAEPRQARGPSYGGQS